MQPQTKQSVTGWQIKRGDINDVKQMYKEAIKGTGNEKVKIILGDIPTQTKNLIKDKFGIDLTGYKRSVTKDALNHINDKHGVKAGKYAVNPDDFAKYEEITTRPDKIAKTKSKDGLLDTITYYKRDGDAYYIVEEIRTGRNELSLKNMYKNKSTAPIMKIVDGNNIKWINTTDNQMFKVLSADNPQLTSNSPNDRILPFSDSSVDTIIPQNTENVAKNLYPI